MTATVSTATGVAGYWLVTADGGVFSFGAATSHGSLPALGVNADIVGMAALPDGRGYWLVGRDGGVFCFGTAEYWGSVPERGVTARIAGMAAMADGSGYWLVGEDGSVFAFGDAESLGCLPGAGVAAKAVGITALDDGSGYWIVVEDGTVYTFGTAPYMGSFHGRTAPALIVGMTVLPASAGYWLLGEDGRVFAFGDAIDHVALPPGADVEAVGMIATGPEGYLLVSVEGRILPCGLASFHGSMPAGATTAPVVAAASVTSPDVLGTQASRLLAHLQSLSANSRRAEVTPARTALPFGGITLPPVDTPRVSVVIPVHGKSHLTVNCLHSIAVVGGAVPFEVIVVDDASPDDTESLLKRIGNLKTVSIGVNVGFTRACNAGIRAASGEYIVLLNNDTQVMPGWLEALTDTADDDPEIGVVGAKLLYPDGTLQEAGGIIWNDATGLNYGNGDAAHRPEYEYRREVDYCSGACILVRRELLDRLGGLDERYSPAYYEDTDLAFAARSLGYKVVYQPLATIVHYEGGSHGTDLTAGIKRYQTLNRLIFAEKWAKELRGRYPPDMSNALLARDTRRGPRALVIDHLVPLYDQDSGSVRMFALLSMLIDLGFVVTFLSDSETRFQPYTDQLQQLGVEVLNSPVAIGPHIRRFGSSLTLCILSRPSVACKYIGTVRAHAPQATLVYDTVDLHFLRERRYGEVNNDVGAIEASKATREIELALVRAADLTFTVSPAERRVMLEEIPEAAVVVVPNIHADHLLPANEHQRHGLLFVGSFCHDPNRDSVHHLVGDIMPLLRMALPGVVLTIVGSSPTPDVLDLETHDVKVLGWVPDLEPIFARTRVFVAPLRFGAGMKGKIGEALSYGIPTVTSTVGAEGMGLVPEEHVLLADDPVTFVSQVVRLHTDNELWTRVSERGRAHIAGNFSPNRIRDELRTILENAGALPGRAEPA